MEVGSKVVLLGQKMTGTFRQYLGMHDEEMVILLTKPQADGAQTIVVPTSEVEVLEEKKKPEIVEEKKEVVEEKKEEVKVSEEKEKPKSTSRTRKSFVEGAGQRRVVKD